MNGWLSFIAILSVCVCAYGLLAFLCAWQHRKLMRLTITNTEEISSIQLILPYRYILLIYVMQRPTTSDDTRVAQQFCMISKPYSILLNTLFFLIFGLFFQFFVMEFLRARISRLNVVFFVDIFHLLLLIQIRHSVYRI